MKKKIGIRRWSTIQRGTVSNLKIDAFLTEVLKICKKHRFAIDHEDSHGSFIVVPWDKGEPDWLFNATDGTDEGTIIE